MLRISLEFGRPSLAFLSLLPSLRFLTSYETYARALMLIHLLLLLFALVALARAFFELVYRLSIHYMVNTSCNRTDRF